MREGSRNVHPYIPNSVPKVKREMLEAVGAGSETDLFEDIPEALRLGRPLDLPDPLVSEVDLKRHVEEILDKNRTCRELLSFLGAGCYRHHVPAVCDEVNQRSEFLTAYAGEPYDDHGRFQALFEYASMMGDLLDMDVVNVPTYDGLQAAATAVRMAARITGRPEVLVGGAIDPALRSKLVDYGGAGLDVRGVAVAPATGQLDRAALEDALSASTAAVFFQNPGFLGQLETHGAEIAAIGHEHGALCVVGVDPISLGILAPPVDYGADIVCGDVQGLGMHMQFGGGQAGFIATRDEPCYVMEYPSRLFGIAPTAVDGEYGFGDVAYERTSFAERVEGKEFVGTASALWGITAGVYLAAMGPQGMAELGEGIMLRARYLMSKLDGLPGVRAPIFDAPHFKEFVVNFDGTGRPVRDVSEALLREGILLGTDLSDAFPDLGQSALLCVTEVHTRADLDRLVEALRRAVS